jgi:transposase-like protein
MAISSLVERTRMMLESALEGKATACIRWDHYERSSEAGGRRGGSKADRCRSAAETRRAWLSQVKNAGGPFHSLILSPRVTQMDEVYEIIPLLYINGLSSREGKGSGGAS